MLRLIGRIIDSGAGIHAADVTPHWFPGDQLLDAARPKGLPIGNLTSQFFANVLLDPVDHFIKAWAEQANASQIRKTLIRKIRLKRGTQRKKSTDP